MIAIVAVGVTLAGLILAPIMEHITTKPIPLSSTVS